MEGDGILADRTLADAAAHLEPVSVAAAIHAAFEVVKPLADAGDRIMEMVSPDPALRIQADPALLHRVLINLLSNSTKHCPAGTHIFCSAMAVGARAVISIAGNGPGIPVESKSTIFFRSKSSDTSPGRTHSSFGLGLDFCRRAVEAMNGSIEVADTPGRRGHFPAQTPGLLMDLSASCRTPGILPFVYMNPADKSGDSGKRSPQA